MVGCVLSQLKPSGFSILRCEKGLGPRPRTFSQLRTESVSVNHNTTSCISNDRRQSQTKPVELDQINVNYRQGENLFVFG